MLKPLFVLAALLLFARMPQQPAAPAPASMPADAKTLVNPVKPSAESQAQARKMYGDDCAI